MKIELFAKKMKKKEGGTFTKYLTKIIKKNTGEKVSCEVKFCEEVSKPKSEKCPCYIEIEEASYSERKQGEYINRTLWVSNYHILDEEWVDHSMEEVAGIE